MSTNRFFVATADFAGDEVRLSREQARQVQQVLRLGPGDMIAVLDGQGMEYDVRLTTVGKSEAAGQIAARRPAAGEPAVELTLFQSLLIREKFEWVLQKGTEVGVAQFVPVLTSRGIVRTKEIDEGKLDRWRRIVTEAAEQSHRGRVPRIEPIVPFAEVFTRFVGFHRWLIAAPAPETTTLRDALRDMPGQDASVALLIGPEGGFTDEEVALARAQGALAVGLGPRIMRTETAATVASALVLYELGEMEP
ncbi:MAG: 16S rRNA (uracil(1498)-N(3))-methyltransferase [Planctomycetes bacterium]|jgi:16S rRNA (uracil1498-N3)-methyltransferase|nr:16S rRNA (uracil(1498)-N(3))-methyltransferase [Planctomycetota bacterium]